MRPGHSFSSCWLQVVVQKDQRRQVDKRRERSMSKLLLRCRTAHGSTLIGVRHAIERTGEELQETCHRWQGQIG